MAQRNVSIAIKAFGIWAPVNKLPSHALEHGGLDLRSIQVSGDAAHQRTRIFGVYGWQYSRRIIR